MRIGWSPGTGWSATPELSGPALQRPTAAIRSEKTHSMLDQCIHRATDALLAQQRSDGHWVFELEADATIPAEYIALQHFLGEPDSSLEAKLANYLRRLQEAHGGWPLYHGGPFNISASVKAYLALKLVGDPPNAAHMQRARDAILAHGGAGTSNVFTRILLALYGFISWSAVPVIPVEVVFLPRWFPFHLSRVSYWTRTVLVPLLVLGALKPRARNPKSVQIDELFPHGRARSRSLMRAPHQSRAIFTFFASVDAILRLVEPWVPRRLRQRAIEKAVAFIIERLNGENGLGAIFPAMANSVMMFDALGYHRNEDPLLTARRAIARLLVIRPDEAYCQPCVSPVWDTALSCETLLEVGGDRTQRAIRRALMWLKGQQILSRIGDWSERRPETRPGGWAFQYANPHYPDLDDTAVVVMAMDRFGRLSGDNDKDTFRESIERARQWVIGMQSENGGWGAFDADNTSEYLNQMPFADHGALVDPPTADVTARCVGMLAQLDVHSDQPVLAKGLEFLRRSQEGDGSWYGRWGMNYVYGTWSALCALRAAGADSQSQDIRRAVEWLIERQNDDGGWGESGESYDLDHRGASDAQSTASQTAWAVLGLMAAGESDHAAVTRGIDYLVRTQCEDGFWNEPQFTATGFPRVFYLRYHGYAKFFPLWAVARYRKHRLLGRLERSGL